MILKGELQEYARMLGYNLGQAEMDYLQHVFLLFLSRNTANSLIFKGGTALQKVYSLNRFSVDLDFTQAHETNTHQIMEKVSKNITEFGYKNTVQEIKTIGKTFKINIQGPLYTTNPSSIYHLRVEISTREDVLLKPNLKQIIPLYRDLTPYTLLVMHEHEILAEKVRAIMTRNKSRDVFDFFFLIKKGATFDVQSTNIKLAYYQETFEEQRFIKKVKEKEAGWDKELKNYLQRVPDFREVSTEIIKHVQTFK
ncbi:nucleotidyl transferase AbiEii/AbiGii toxin family protein [Candidatus Woesearchaeota archaeon]|nr:nucleotidyl transferase AbiEii/AbiGii toxin family protein [Candidatus Woesearchaeota archaeon]